MIPLNYRLMRILTRHRTTRSLSIRTIKSLIRNRRPFPVNKESVIQPVNTAAVLKELESKGYCLNISLKQETLQAILDYCRDNQARVNRNPDRLIRIDMENPANPVEGEFIYSYYNTYKNCEAVKAIAHDPQILAVVKEYLGAEPILLGTQIWWSYPHVDKDNNKLDTHVYGYHYDIDDFKFIKLFFYLNDVDEETGPHVIISGTHRQKDAFEKKNRRISEAVAIQRYKERIHVITGKAGSGFFEDTFAYHKGMNPSRRRLLFQVQYGLCDYNMQNDNA
jgi:hypothetical protein